MVEGTWVLPSHRHGHLIVFILTFLFIKDRFGIVSIQLEGRVAKRDDQDPRGKISHTLVPRSTSGVRRRPGSL